jgi:hypothetical protein
MSPLRCALTSYRHINQPTEELTAKMIRLVGESGWEEKKKELNY